MATPFRLELVTPERLLYGDDAEEVSMRTVEGEITFLARHEDFVGALSSTVVRIHAVGRIEASAGEVRAAVHGGAVHVDRDGVTILAGVAETSGEIDVGRAERALEAARERLAAAGEGEGDADEAATARAEAEAAISRAETRLEAAGADGAG